MSYDVEIAELATDFFESENVVYNGHVSTEPCLKYREITHGVNDIVSTDCITCVAAHEKFIALGTKWGRVHLLDHNGFPAENGIHSVHSTSVNGLSISEQADYVASCADDGRLAIYNLSEPESNQTITFDYVITSVALAPDFYRKQNIVIGSSEVFFISSGIFSKTKHESLATVKGFVTDIKWSGDYVIWADRVCVCVFDIRFRRPLTYMKFTSQEVDLLGNSLTCHLHWFNKSGFFVGRGHSITICKIMVPLSAVSNGSLRTMHRSRQASVSSSIGSLSLFGTSVGSDVYISDSFHTASPNDKHLGMINRHIEVVHQVELGSHLVIRGISRHQNHLMLLLCNEDKSKGSTSVGWELIVADVGDLEDVYGGCQMVYKEIYREQLALKCTLAELKSVGLVSVNEENTHYIFCTKELRCVQELSVDDRIDWLLARSEYVRAVDLARSHNRHLVQHSIQSVGIAYVDYLISKRQFDEAAKLSSEVLDKKDAWHECIYKFYHLGQLQAISPYLPNSIEERSIRLDSAIYELFLMDYMDHNPVEFAKLLRLWTRLDLVRCNDKLVKALNDRIEHCQILACSTDISKLDIRTQSLYRGLAIIHEHNGHYDAALNLLVRLKDAQVFDLLKHTMTKVNSSRWIEVVREHLIYFFDLDRQQMINLLLTNINDITVDFVIKKLEPNSEHLFYYLDAVYNRFPSLVIKPYSVQLIALYIKFCRDKLLPLLRSTDQYPLSEALHLCEQAKFVAETVYLLTRVGRRQDALQLIMTRGGDDLRSDTQQQQPTFEQRQAAAASAAIAYCREEDSVRSIHDGGLVNSNHKQNGELWQQVVLFAVDKPAFICALLQHAALEGLDPRLLLRKVSPDMPIPGLKDALVKLMHDYKIQLELNERCKRILSTDIHQLYKRLLDTQARGILIDPTDVSSATCVVCSQPLNTTGETSSRNDTDGTANCAASNDWWVVYRCKHMCHQSCLTAAHSHTPSREKCAICSKLRITS